VSGYNVSVGGSSTSTAGADIKDRFFLMLGQSNMLGIHVADGGIDVGNSNIYHILDDGTAELATAPVNNYGAGNSNGVGMSLAFAREYSAHYPSSKIYLGLCAQGSTSIGSGGWKKGGTNYNRAIEVYNRGIALGLECGGIMWHQGKAIRLKNIGLIIKRI
jgi:hypothetical protein